jgi:hypothetical protein
MERDQSLIVLWGDSCVVLKRMMWSLSNFCDDDDDPLNAHALVLWLAITATKEVLSCEAMTLMFAAISLQVASSTIS